MRVLCNATPVYVRTADIPHLSYRAREGLGEIFHCDISNDVPHETHVALKVFPKEGKPRFQITVSWNGGSRPIITYESFAAPDEEPEPGSWGPNNMNYDPPRAD